MSKKVLGISGSTRTQSSNRSLLNYIKAQSKNHEITIFDKILGLPLYSPEIDEYSLHENVIEVHNYIKESDATIIVTPEYLGSIPAALKNFLEWNNKHNLLSKKTCLLICYTPKSPRGERCLDHLNYSMKSLGADIRVSELIHHDQISFNEDGSLKEYNLEYALEDILEIID